MKKLLAVLVCTAMLLALFSACSGNNAGQTQASSQTQASTQATIEDDGIITELTLPLTEEPIELTIWAGLSSRAAASIKNYGEMLAYQELQERTGIQIQFMHPPVGQEKEQFNLMLASQELPDLIHYSWGTDYVGGPEKAISDGVILELSDYIQKNSPNFSSILDSNPQVAKDSVTDNGYFYMYPLLRIDPSCRVSGGFQIRKDWLDKLQLQIPTNIDEWYNVLTAFKNNDLNGNGDTTDELPFIATKIGPVNGVQRFTEAWGIGYDYYIEDGQVKYGPAQPEYKEFLETMRKWYTEGLIDPDFLITDKKTHDAKVTSEIAGSYYGLLNSYMGTYTGVMKDKGTGFQLESVPAPIAPDGKQYNFKNDEYSPVANEGMAITAVNKYPDLSARLLDYYYSDEGRILMNLGIEGVTFTMENGKPKYTDVITNNPDGLPRDRAAAKHMPVGTSARLYQDIRYWNQMMVYDNQIRAMDTLAQASTDKTLPPLTPTPEEATNLASIQNEINTYVNEMFARFIMGQDDIESFDQYIETLKSMKLDEALAIQQGALERYQSR